MQLQLIVPAVVIFSLQGLINWEKIEKNCTSVAKGYGEEAEDPNPGESEQSRAAGWERTDGAMWRAGVGFGTQGIQNEGNGKDAVFAAEIDWLFS